MVIIGLFSRLVVGWLVSARMSTNRNAIAGTTRLLLLPCQPLALHQLSNSFVFEYLWESGAAKVFLLLIEQMVTIGNPL